MKYFTFAFHSDQYDCRLFDGQWMSALKDIAAENVPSDEFNQFIEAILLRNMHDNLWSFHMINYKHENIDMFGNLE